MDVEGQTENCWHSSHLSDFQPSIVQWEIKNLSISEQESTLDRLISFGYRIARSAAKICWPFALEQFVTPRVLHVVESLDRGAVENWLMRTYREAKRMEPTTDWTFYCTLTRDGAHDQGMRQAGAKVIHSPCEWNQVRPFMRALRHELKQGQYDVLHCHHDFMSALYLLSSFGLKLKQRIVHVHNTDEALPTPSRLKRALLLEPFRTICRVGSDKVIGISRDTLATFLKGRKPRTGRDLVRYYNIDETAFHNVAADRSEFFKEIAANSDARLLLCLGRMVALKNPVQTVEIMVAIMKVRPEALGVFAGDGDLLEAARRRAAELGMRERFRFLGWRTDTIRIMKCSDLLIFPRLESPKEGLGLVLVESQVAGLPVLTTPGITDDAIFTDMVERIPLASTTH